MASPQNEIFLNKQGVIEIIYHGDQTPVLVTDLIGRLNALADKLRREGEAVNCIIDFSDFGKTDLSTNRLAGQALLKMEYHRMAGFGATPFVRALTNLISRASGKASKNRHFETRAEAERWLKQRK